MPDYDPRNIPILDDVIELEDITEPADTEKGDFDLSVTSTEPLETVSDSTSFSTENKLDMFASEAVDLAAESSGIASSVTDVAAVTIADSIIEHTISPAEEPQIGAIDNISNEDDNSHHGQTVAEQDIYPETYASSATQGAIDEEQLSKSNEDVHMDETAVYSTAKASVNEVEIFESALIDYNAVDETKTSIINMPDSDQQESDQPVAVKQQSSTTDSLQSITDDIVKQLMPELEQQLRLLLKQALKEKLPEETSRIEASPSSNIDS